MKMKSYVQRITFTYIRIKYGLASSDLRTREIWDKVQKLNRQRSQGHYLYIQNEVVTVSH